ncbi:hypothetical protein Vadar_009026 [Vaccinium darrowii]|uniref:Uncharacterized protein n=1 Tax=Vaccinium darrowii TaxID=229202 RepID=A0ACB7WZM9_9ERIC|nr:hypothetical protein Vadar_009026 [Vaccinium darrowii]
MKRKEKEGEDIIREDEGVVAALDDHFDDPFDDPFDNFGEVPDGFGVESGIKGGCLAAEEGLDVAEQLGTYTWCLEMED